MARRNIFDRAREFLAGTSRKVVDSISDFFGRSNDPIDNEELTPIIDFVGGSSDENQDSINETEQPSDEQIAEEIEKADPPTQTFPPEEPDEEGEIEDEIAESEFDIIDGEFGAFNPADLRRILVTLEEAEAYAREIPQDKLNITIVRDRSTRLFRVLVEYEIVVAN